MLLQIYKPDSAAPPNFCLTGFQNWVKHLSQNNSIKPGHWALVAGGCCCRTVVLHCSNFSWVWLINWRCMRECSSSEWSGVWVSVSGVGLVKHQRGTLSVWSVTAFSGHMTQIGRGHSPVFYEGLMSKQFYGSAALRLRPTRFDGWSEVEGEHMCERRMLCAVMAAALCSTLIVLSGTFSSSVHVCH